MSVGQVASKYLIGVLLLCVCVVSATVYDWRGGKTVQPGGSAQTGENVQHEVENVYTPHDSIYVSGNDEFTSASGVVSGAGAENDPYIIENWDINAENTYGIEITHTDVYFTIRNCYIHDAEGVYSTGIRLENVTNGKIENCSFSKSGIALTGNYGLDNWTGCYNIVVRNCTISDNSIGLYLSSNILIENCTISNGSEAISLGDSPNNIIRNCTLENNEFGITIGGSYAGAHIGMSTDNNRIYHNNFINNTTQASPGVFSNYWDNGYPSGGNYWSDYVGEDNYSGENQDIAGSDGIGDTPYIISDVIQDNYPLMNPVEKAEISELGAERIAAFWFEFNRNLEGVYFLETVGFIGDALDNGESWSVTVQQIEFSLDNIDNYTITDSNVGQYIVDKETGETTELFSKY